MTAQIYQFPERTEGKWGVLTAPDGNVHVFPYIAVSDYVSGDIESIDPMLIKAILADWLSYV